MSNTDNLSDTGSGLLQGVQPAQPRLASEWGGQQRPDQAVTQPVVVNNAPNDQRPAYRWTDEDIENARKQEKDKLYPRIDEMGEQLKRLEAERQAEQAERQRLADEAESARKAKEEQEMDLRALMEKRDSEWKSQMDALTSRYEADREVFNKERQLQEAELYRRDRIAQEAEFILPELRDFIIGTSPDEIDQSIAAMKARTEQIVANFVAAEPPPVPFQPRSGAAPTAPPVGPMEQLPSYESLTPEDIKGMDMNTYKKHREALLQATSPNRRRG